MREITTTQQIRLGLALRNLVDAWTGPDADLDAWVEAAERNIDGMEIGEDIVWDTTTD